MLATLEPSSKTVIARAVTRKVCHVSLTLKTGGLERLLADFARLADPQRLDQTFLAIGDVGRFADEIRAGGGTVHQLSPARQLSPLRQLNQVQQMKAFFRKHQFDVVHTHNTYPHLYASLAARLAGVPVVVQTRHGQRIGHGWKSRIQYRLATYMVDRVITVSDDAANLSVNQDHLPVAKVDRIWNGIDLEQFAYTGPARAMTAISVARLSHEKDFPTLLRATALVVKAIPEFRLQLVGDGPERARIEKMVAELGLGDVVTLLGERHDVPALLSQAGFFVSSSLSEGISLTLLEAMAIGLPVVATAVGGNPEIVVHGQTGFLAPAKNPAALADAMITVCRVRDRWSQLGLAGRERVAEHFEIRRMIADYADLYDRLLATKRRRNGRPAESLTVGKDV